jgi:hypothetical protein
MVRTFLPQNYLKKPIRPDLGEAACSRDRRAESATGITQINLEERMHGWRLPDETHASISLPIGRRQRPLHHAPAQSIGARPRLDQCQNQVFIARHRRSFMLDFVFVFDGNGEIPARARLTCIRHEGTISFHPMAANAPYINLGLTWCLLRCLQLVNIRYKMGVKWVLRWKCTTLARC